MKNLFIILAFAILIIVSYRPRKTKQSLINHGFDPALYKLTKVDAG